MMVTEIFEKTKIIYYKTPGYCFNHVPGAEQPVSDPTTPTYNNTKHLYSNQLKKLKGFHYFGKPLDTVSLIHVTHEILYHSRNLQLYKMSVQRNSAYSECRLTS